MNRIGRGMVLFLVTFSLPAFAMAGPTKGGSIVLGLGSHANEVGVGGSTETYDSGSVAFGVDYQTPLGESTSINLQYLMWFDSSQVTNESPAATASISEMGLGLQARYWPTDAMFVGAHLGLYSQSLTFDTFLPEQGFGLGLGVAGGLEMEIGQNKRLTLTAQYDRVPSMDVITGLGATDLSGFTLLVGLRFVQP